jgi:GNAT superfamily N-acetyltransferase
MAAEAQRGVVFVDRDGGHVLVRSATLAEIITLRHIELRPGLPEDTARFDGDLEPTTWHFGGFPREGTPGADAAAVACASFMLRVYDGEPAYQLRGMATRAAMVGRGLGGALLRHAVAKLTRNESPLVRSESPLVRSEGPLVQEDSRLMRPATRLFWCNARVSALQFYLRMGWRVASDFFDVPTVGPHRVMVYRVPSESLG